MPSLSRFIKECSSKEFIDDLEKETVRTRTLICNPTFHKKIQEYLSTDQPALTAKSIGTSLKILATAIFKTQPALTLARAILSAFNKWIPAIYLESGAASQQKLMGEIRKIILDNYPEGHKVIALSYRTMRFDQALLQNIRKEYSQSVSMRNQDKMIFTDIDIYRIIDTCAADSEDWRLNAIGIELAIGARMNEILSLSEFKQHPDKSNWIIQTGLSKQKDETEERSIHKPIIRISFEQLDKMIKNVRHSLGPKVLEKNNYEISQAEIGPINVKVAELFSNDEYKVTSHKLRSIYGDLSYKLFADVDKISLQAWVSLVLGHSPGSIATASSYTTVSVRILDGNDQAQNEINKMKEQIRKLIKEAEIQDAEKKEAGDIPDEVPPNPKLRDGRVMDRLLHSVRVMNLKDIEVTRPALRDLKYGSPIINEYFKKMHPL